MQHESRKRFKVRMCMDKKNFVSPFVPQIKILLVNTEVVTNSWPKLYVLLKLETLPASLLKQKLLIVPLAHLRIE